jgi:hypothetical protein
MNRINLLVGGLLVLAVAAVTFWLTVRHPSPPRLSQRAVLPAATVAQPAVAPNRPHLAPPPPEPTFTSPEQTVRYYGALVQGERRALAVVEDALRKARAGNAGWEHSSRLEAMRADYQQRIQRHQSQLDGR